jgi:predicted flap endonuclease-1-like 5' DNA nuclease
MSGDIPERVTCEVCGTAFDPRESRGWCPNSACGKWQHPAFPLSGAEDGRRGAADGGVDAPTKVCPSCGKDVRADANFCKFCSHQFPDEPAEQEETGGPDPGLDECPDCGADLSSIPPDRLEDCPICGTNLRDVIADQSESSVTPADLTDCPACGEDLTSIPADMRMVCPGCRIGLEEAIETHGVSGDAEPAEPDQSDTAAGGPSSAGAAGGGAGAEPEEGETEAPSDGPTADVDTIRGIGASYAERLSGAGVETVGDLVGADVGELAATTDISEKRIGEWIENAPLDPGDVGGPSPDQGDDAGATGGEDRIGGQEGGQTTGGGRASSGQHGGPGRRGSNRGSQRGGQGDVPSRDRIETQVQPGYDTVVLEVMGQEIRARPGDTVGREIRTAMVEGGAPDNDAVYVHREHARVEREGDTFYLVRLGQNSLKLNGEPIEQHERAEVSNGDEVSFSEVVTADIRIE